MANAKNDNIKIRQSVTLTERLLEEIRNSIRVFKPSKSLSMLSKLAEDYERDHAAAEIDIVISGGGMKGYFMTGCYDVLYHELKRRNVKIARVAGASAGAWSGLFMCTGLGTRRWIETYYGWKERENTTIHEAYDDMYLTWIKDVLPVDSYKKCNGRLFISISVFNSYGMLENKIISEYTSNDDLFECCCASSTIPIIAERYGLRKFRGQYVFDGSLTNDLPVFKDHLRRQLVFQLSELDYSMKLSMTNTDDCIEVLVLRGAMLMAQFLEGNKTTKAIAWLDINENKDQLEHLPNASFLAIYNKINNNKYKLLSGLLLCHYCFRDVDYAKLWSSLGMISMQSFISYGMKGLRWSQDACYQFVGIRLAWIRDILRNAM